VSRAPIPPDGAAIARLLEGKRICICAGPGGVGKTTVSAAIAAGMASRGGRVAVLTIDPARRLANSLGLSELGNEERLVDPAHLERAGIEMRGELWAMMLDAKRTFDGVIEAYAPDAATRDAVLSNRIYQELSSAVAGSQEYMAMEKLHELHDEGRYDLLVLDTPPTRHALDFLDAPERLSRFIDSPTLQFFSRQGRTSIKLIGRGTGLVFSILGRATGVDMLHDLSDFFQSFGDMAGGFRERAAGVARLLGDPRTAFVVVSSPQSDSVDEAIFFGRRLRERRMPLAAVVVNRLHDGAGFAKGSPATVERQAAGQLGPELARKLARNFEEYRLLAKHDRRSVARLRNELEGAALVPVPYLDDDVHDLGGLALMNEHLFASG
jgi:anion-transporting  ArsA/GET3 family ATPase